MNPGWKGELVKCITELDRHMKQCQESFQYFYTDDPGETLSPLVRDPSRDMGKLMIIEKDVDLESIEKSSVYKGQYFVLGGLVPIVESKTNKFLHIDELLALITKRKPTEIILAFSIHPEGEHTSNYIAQKLKTFAKDKNLEFTISTLGRGLSTGTELEYSDIDTLKSAFETRR